MQILRNFVVHKPHTRKTCFTEPLRRIIEPLRRNIEPHCGIIEPLRGNVEHHCEVIEPIQRNMWPHCGTIEPLRRKIEHLSSKAKQTCENIESVYGINKSFSINQRPALQGERARETSCQNTARKSFSDRETIDVKAVVNRYENSHEIIVPRDCHMIDRSSSERSITVYRLTVNNQKSMDTCILETGNLHSFYTAYFPSQSSHAHKNCRKNFKSKQYSAPDITLLLSGDIEMNPGPAENVINISICFSPQGNSILLTTRLHRHGLRPLDVVGGGDCYFRADAHQLYGDPNFHLNIRPRFLESRLN